VLNKIRESARARHRAARLALVAFTVGFALAAGAAGGGSTGALPPGHPPGGEASTAPAKPANGKPVKPVDINSASRAQLKTLPGIGDAEADRIIAGRPYLSKAELVTKGVMPEGVYLSLRRQLIALQTGKPPVAGK